MTLSRKIAAAAETRLDGAILPCPASFEDGPARLTLELNAIEPVGVAFGTLDFAVSDRPELSTVDLRAWGNRLAARLTYLMEPLVVLEVDAEAGEAELRSQNPTAKDDHRSFTEVRLWKDNSLQMRRLRFDGVTRRRVVVASQMTVEALERLADDLVALSI